MTALRRCEREDELLDALGAGFVEADLDAHVAGCTSCRDLRDVAGALLDDRSEAIREAAVPSSATMWWRMQMRHRQDVATAARRSLFAGQALTLLFAIGLVALLFGGQVAVGMRDLIATWHWSAPILLAIVSTIVLAPLAGFVALRSR